MRPITVPTLLALAALTACKNDKATDSGTAGTGGGSGGDDTGTTGEPDPPYNYIPLNDKACDLADAAPGVQAQVNQQILDLINEGDTYADDGFEVCTETPLPGCLACNADDNQFLRLVRDIDTMGLSEIILGEGQLSDDVSSGKPDDLLEYIQRSLHYPYRHLTATVSTCSELEPGSCPELCTNDTDDDNDGFADCDDSDCAADSRCITGEVCDDDIDNDGDGEVDCGDNECAASSTACVAEVCDNGADDNGDGFADCEDVLCEASPACGAVRSRVVLTQTADQPCEDGSIQCGHYSVEPESLDLSCTQFSLTFFGSLGQKVDETTGTPIAGTQRFRGELYTEAVEDVTLGFVVPIVGSAELPDLSQPMSDAELRAWLETLEANDKTLEARLRDPVLDLRIDTSASEICGRIDGSIEDSFIRQFVEGEDPTIADLIVNTLVPQYEDPDHPGDIPTSLAFSMKSGTFTSGAVCQPNPCAETDGTCTGDVLDYTLQDDTCVLQRTTDFVSGTELTPSCEVGTTYDAQVDCAALGGTCDETNISCDPAWREPAAGEIVITEVFTGTQGANYGIEWVEVLNTTTEPLYLNDCRFHGRDTEYGERDAITGFDPVLIAPGQYFTIGVLDLGHSTTENFHGVQIDHALRGEEGIYHTDASDVFRIECDLAGAWTEIDRVAWSDLTDYRSWQLDPGATDATSNDSASNWCEGTDVFRTEGDGTTMTGTPGAANPACP